MTEGNPVWGELCDSKYRLGTRPAKIIRALSNDLRERAASTVLAGDAGSYAGAPDWLPKQGHVADLQAKAAVENAIAFLAGKPASATFKAELVCIVDTLNSGVMVYRTPERSFVLPNPLWHLAKRAFEWRYLQRYHG